MGQPIVGDKSDTEVVEEWWDESDTIAHRIRAVRGREQNPEPDRRMAGEEKHRKMQARKAEDETVFDGLRRRYKRQAAENEADLMARVWETERAQVVRLSTRWVENVANVRAPSGAQRNRQLQSSNAALADLRERRRTQRSLQGALRRAARLPAGRAGRLPDYPQAYHSPRDEGVLDPSRRSRHSYVVDVDREDEVAWIVDPLHLQPAQDQGVSFQRAGFTVHAVQEPWRKKVAQKQKCSYLAVKTASAFMYRPTDEWKIPEPGYVFDKDKSMTEQHREEQHSMLEWLRGWAEIKVQRTGKRRGRYVPKRPQIVNTAETTLQEGLRLSGYTPLSKEAMMAAPARRSGRAPDAMKSVVAGPEPVLMPAAPDMEWRYCSTSRAQELLGLAHPSRQWSRSKTRKAETVAKARWLVLMVTETESGAVDGMRAPGRPRRQETKQASKSKEEETEEEQEEEEEEEEPAQKRRKC